MNQTILKEYKNIKPTSLEELYDFIQTKSSEEYDINRFEEQKGQDIIIKRYSVENTGNESKTFYLQKTFNEINTEKAHKIHLKYSGEGDNEILIGGIKLTNGEISGPPMVYRSSLGNNINIMSDIEEDPRDYFELDFLKKSEYECNLWIYPSNNTIMICPLTGDWVGHYIEVKHFVNFDSKLKLVINGKGKFEILEEKVGFVKGGVFEDNSKLDISKLI